MLKGKTIHSVAEDLNAYGIRNTVVLEKPKTLVPRKVINVVTGVDPITLDQMHQMHQMQPSNAANVMNGKVIRDMSRMFTNNLKEEYYSKTINSISTTEQSVQIISENKNIRYSVIELKEKFSGYSNLYYVELFDLLETTDYNLTQENLNSNLQKFINAGNNVQSQISKLNHVLDFIPKVSFKSLKDEIDSKIGFFTNAETYLELFDEFSIKTESLYNTLSTELQNVKNLNFEKYNLVNLYFEFFKFISDELKNKNIASNEFIASSIIGSRVISLNNSITVLNQFKMLIDVEINAKELELNNLKNYLDVLKPSLFLLKQQNFTTFRDNFKTFIKES